MIGKYSVRTIGRHLKKLISSIAALAMAAVVTIGTVGAEECLVKAVKLEKQEKDADSIVINMTGCPAPKVSGLEGPPPRIVLDFPAGRFQGCRTLQMDVSGGSVVKIRGAKHDHPLNMFRIVLDLKPRRSYGAEQTWLQGEDKYIIKVAPETPASP